MRKMLLAVTLVLMVAISAMPTAATPVDELTGLAQYFPEGTDFFVTVRTDDAYFETLNGVLDSINAQVPGLLPPFTINDLLDQLALSLNETGGDFETQIRPWLGNSAALAVVSFEDMLAPSFDADDPFIVAFSVADQAAAETFLDNATTAGFGGYEYEKQTIDAGLLYTPDSQYWTSYLLADGVLLLRSTNFDATTLAPPTGPTLADDAMFNDAVANLPTDDYNILGYINFTGAIADLLEMEIAMADEDDMMIEGGMSPQDIVALMRAFGPQVFGFTILDGQSLAVDFVVAYNDFAAIEAMGIPIGEPGGAVNPDFAANIPADSALVIMDSNFANDTIAQLEALKAAGEMLDMTLTEQGIEPDDDEFVLTLLDDVMAFTLLTYKGLVGQPLEDHIGWMTGDYAVYNRAAFYANGLGFDAGLVIERTADADIDGFLTGVRNALFELNIGYEEADAGTLVIPGIKNIVETVFELDDAEFLSALELLIAANDDVMVLGTRSGAELVLAGEGGLAGTDAYQTATSAFLDGSQSVAYMAVEPLSELTRALAELTGEMDLMMVAQLLDVVESASITAVSSDDMTVNTARFVLTLSN